MKMSANEHQSVDVRLYANRRSNLDLEELNRMERPSRVFSSRHHFSMPPVLPSMDDERRSRESSIIGNSQRILSTGDILEVVNVNEPHRSKNFNFFENLNNGSTRLSGGSMATNGDISRNRSSFVNFTITDPETRQITAAGQIPLLSSPSSSHQNLNNSSGADSLINVGSDDEMTIMDYRGPREPRRFLNHYNSNVHAPSSSRYPRSGRRLRRITDHPYYTRNELDNNPSNSRTSNHRRVRFSSTNRSLNDSPDRSQTPEQELPEVEEQEMEPENQYEDVVYDGEESMSSLSSIIDADSSDTSMNFSVSENQNSNLDLHHQIRDFVYIPNDTPRTRAVPFIMSPIPISPRPISPPDLSHTLPSNNPIIGTRTSPPLLVAANVEEDHIESMPPLIDFDALPGSNPFEFVPFHSVVRPEVINNILVNRVLDVESNNTANNTANGLANNTISTLREALSDNDERLIREVNNQLIVRPSQPTSASVTQRDNQPRSTDETSTVRIEEHPETYDDLNEQLTRLFECPVCFEHIIPPIFQCLVGHLICNKCVLMCENCPTCRNPFNSKRNLYMEKVGYLVKFPCRNALTGCKQQMFIAQKEIHEQACCFRHYQCFFTNCAWKGYYPELHAHMTHNHSNCILDGTEQSLDIMLPSNNQTYKWFLLAHSEYFAIIAHSSLLPRRVKIQVNYIGQAVKAKNFKFVITLTQHKDRISDDNMSQKLVYERSTLPYSEIYEMSNNNSLKKDIFSFPVEVLEPYIKKRRRRLPIVLKVYPKNN